jgi:hypothetical protein
MRLAFLFLFSFVLLLTWEAQRKDRDLVLIMAFRSAGLRGKLSAVFGYMYSFSLVLCESDIIFVEIA